MGFCLGPQGNEAKMQEDLKLGFYCTQVSTNIMLIENNKEGI